MIPPPPPSPARDVTPPRREKKKKKKRKNADETSDRRASKRRRTREVSLASVFHSLYDSFERVDHARRTQERPITLEADSPVLPSDDFVFRGTLLGYGLLICPTSFFFFRSCLHIISHLQESGAGAGWRVGRKNADIPITLSCPISFSITCPNSNTDQPSCRTGTHYPRKDLCH